MNVYILSGLKKLRVAGVRAVDVICKIIVINSLTKLQLLAIFIIAILYFLSSILLTSTVYRGLADTKCPEKRQGNHLKVKFSFTLLFFLQMY